jgi:hypothetical protein
MKRAGITEALTMVPDGGEEDTREVTVRTLVRRYHGSYAACKAARPAEGTVNPDGYIINKTTLKRIKAGQGELIIYGSRQIQYAAGTVVTPVRDNISVRWDRTTRPLRQHRLWKDTPSGVWAEVDAWEKETDSELKSIYQYRIPKIDENGKWDHDEDGQPLYETKTISESLLQLYCDKRLNGQESFMDWHPVISRVRVYPVGKPDSGSCGKIVQLPGDVGFSFLGYEFLKVQHDISSQGNNGAWSLTESWEGYDSIDDDLYSIAAAGPARKTGQAKANRKALK